MLLRPHGDFAELADDGGVAFVTGMHRNRAVAQHGFGPGGGDGDVVARLAQYDISILVFFDIGVGGTPCERVFEVPHVARGFDVFDFEVGDGGLKVRVPVHQALAAVDEALVVHIDKDLDDGVVEIAIFADWRARGTGHSEGVSGPIAGGAETFQLVDDGVAGFCFPGPDFLEEVFAAQLAAGGCAFFGQFAFDNHLRGDACVVLARLPKRVVAAHAVPADQDILQRVVEGVAHVERARHIGRRDHDGEGFRARCRVGAGLEAAFLFPGLVDAVLSRLCVECFVHRRASCVVGA